MIIKALYLTIIIFTMFSVSGCIIRKHTYYDYSTHLPGYTIKEFDSIDRNLYKNYFLDDLYLTVNVTSSDYYPSKKRTGAPYFLWFYGVSKNHRYEKMRIGNCKAISSKRGSIKIDWVPIEYEFKNGTKVESDIYYYSPPKYDTHIIDLDIDAGENLMLSLDLELIDSNGKVYKKNMHYEIRPNIRHKYLETVIDTR